MEVEALEPNPFWAIYLTYRGQLIRVPVFPADPVRAVVEFVVDAFELDADFLKLVHKGVKLDMDGSIESQGLKHGSKLMIIATPAAEVMISKLMLNMLTVSA